MLPSRCGLIVIVLSTTVIKACPSAGARATWLAATCRSPQAAILNHYRLLQQLREPIAHGPCDKVIGSSAAVVTTNCIGLVG